ncbi:hypothetical protein [Frankia sp. ACN1ag]|uniref:hypothetical protein n=1 Tax=Frankia sp. ACN1ag TaxID=102891 RepID=UPI0006DBEE05|nr:hypothetical protein [Frankia sp. ACN1ag]KQC36996.1 hypothetical protein UK82_17370 [Frankia sp. ACN1ag]
MITLRYLDVADSLLRERPDEIAGLWPRACAWLLRLALESAVDDLWARERPAVAQTPMRAQLLSLRYLRALGPEPLAIAEYLWESLSRAVHHHPYELSPTATELRRWHQDVHALALTLGSHRPEPDPTAQPESS